MTAHENPFLGYRITLPSTYRRLPPSYFTADRTTGGLLGCYAYTLLTEHQEREECLQDLGDLGFALVQGPHGAARDFLTAESEAGESPQVSAESADQRPVESPDEVLEAGGHVVADP